jgi:hypothetical protein
MQTVPESLADIQTDLIEIRELAARTPSQELAELLERLANDIEAYARVIDQMV